MKQAYGKQVSETNIYNSGGCWLNPLTEKTQPKLIVTGLHLFSLKMWTRPKQRDPDHISSLFPMPLVFVFQV
jgi:hypothetical protein